MAQAQHDVDNENDNNMVSDEEDSDAI